MRQRVGRLLQSEQLIRAQVALVVTGGGAGQDRRSHVTGRSHGFGLVRFESLDRFVVERTIANVHAGRVTRTHLRLGARSGAPRLKVMFEKSRLKSSKPVTTSWPRLPKSR